MGRTRGRYPTPAEMSEAQRLIAAGRLLYNMVLLGDRAAGDVVRLRARMENPQPGDLVFETSTAELALRDRRHAEVALGWYVRTGVAPWASREEWAASPDRHEYPGQPYEDSPGRQVLIIRPWGSPRGEYVWDNAELRVLPLGG